MGTQLDIEPRIAARQLRKHRAQLVEVDAAYRHARATRKLYGHALGRAHDDGSGRRQQLVARLGQEAAARSVER